MANILFLCHRIPYPPNKGDKIRSFNLLRYLSRNNNVYLGAYVDDPDDWRYAERLDAFTRGCHLEPLRGWRSKLGSLLSLFRREPLSLGYYRTQGMRRWAKRILEQQAIDTILVFSSSMAQYAVIDDSAMPVRRVIDFVDVDSDKWRQYAERHRGVMRWLYQREWQTLLKYERHIARQFDASVFVSEDEARLFKRLAPEVAEKVQGVGNGVDLSFFDPSCIQTNAANSPYATDSETVVFTGAMDYWANVDAVNWFCRHVWRRVRVQCPNALFYIVGANPSADVRQLANESGVIVTGRVDDIRPYLHFARVAVAPMQVARGVQNKILEAMAMNKPIVATRLGFEGLHVEYHENCLLADDPETFAHKVISMLQGKDPAQSSKNRAWVERHFSWESQLDLLEDLLTGRQTGAQCQLAERPGTGY